MLGPDYMELANEAVREGIAQRSQDPDNIYFEPGEGGFESIDEDQTFYLNQAGNAVVVFEKYEIAPGYMGMQEFEIPLPTAKRVFDLAGPLDCTVDCFQNDQGIMDRRYYDRLDYYIPDLISRQMARRNRTPVDDFWAAVQAGGDTVQKIQMYFPHLELRPQVSALLHREIPELIQGISMPANLELNAPEATKGVALRKLCRVLAIDPLDTIAFGDGTNDISMLQAAGMGVAMANAAPETLAAADLAAPSNQEDGVAQILSRWFPE